MSIIDLTTAKNHLRVDTADDDALIQMYLDAAEKSAGSHCNRTLYPDDTAMGADTDGLVLPDEPAVMAAVLLTVGHLYENRSSVDTVQKQELPLGLASLLQPYRINIGV